MNQLTDFIRSRKSQLATPGIDWEARKEAWIRSVELLYSRIEQMLGETIASGDVVLRTNTVSVFEEPVGGYPAPQLEVLIGAERVFFRPKGLNVIGASGRVDLLGEGGTVTLVREESEDQEGWSVILQRTPSLSKTPLNEASLKLALEKVMLPLP